MLHIKYISACLSLIPVLVCVLNNPEAVNSQTQPYPLAQYREDPPRDRWGHVYRRNFRHRGPFQHHHSWEQTTLDPLSRFHYSGISSHNRPLVLDEHQQKAGFSYHTTSHATLDGETNSSEAQNGPTVQRRKLIRPRKPPIIPLQREQEFLPFRYSTNNGNYRQPVTPNLPQQQITTTTESIQDTSRSEETTEHKSYVGLPGYWKPIRVPPYGYNYPRWYHVQRTKATPEPERGEEVEQSIEDDSITTTTKPQSESYEDSTEVTTTELIPPAMYRPPPYHHYRHPSAPPLLQFRPSAPPQYPPSPPPTHFPTRFHGGISPTYFHPRPPSPSPIYPSVTPFDEMNPTFPPTFAPTFDPTSVASSGPLDFHTWLRHRQQAQAAQDAVVNEELTTTSPTTTTMLPETTENEPTTTASPRTTMVFPSVMPKIASTSSLAPQDADGGLFTSETSTTFYTNSVSPIQNDQSQLDSQATFVGPVRHQGNHEHHRQHNHHSEPSDEQQRSASEVDVTIRTHREDTVQLDEQERLKAGEIAGIIIGIVSLIATLVGCVTFLILKKPLAASEVPAFPTPEPTITSIQRTFSGGVYSGDDLDTEEAGDPPPHPPPPGPYPAPINGARKPGLMQQPIPEWSYSPASSIRLSFEEVHQVVQQNQAPSRTSMSIVPDQRERLPGGYL